VRSAVIANYELFIMPINIPRSSAEAGHPDLETLRMHSALKTRVNALMALGPRFRGDDRSMERPWQNETNRR
jgi:hypothetical protein